MDGVMWIDFILTSLDGNPLREGVHVGQMNINENHPIPGYAALWTMFNEPEFQDIMMLMNGVQFHPFVLGALISHHCANKVNSHRWRNRRND
jgi:hypothetical protein